MREHLSTSAFVQSSSGVTVTDVDGNVSYDLTGSYGVNIFGNDFYKECIAEAGKRAHALGPVLGTYHPVITDNVKRLCEISGLDEVSFHMSGTEAVMQAVRLARYHTKRSHLVRFAGAYHGWWGDVQPGVGNPVSPHETYTLADMSERTLHVLKTRRDIACVLVNPLQALHPNANAPGNSALVDSSRSAKFDRAAYGEWLKKLREVCTERGIVLIFDEVFVGFRIAPGGAQEYFRRPRRHGDLRQEPRRRIAGRRGLRPKGFDAAFSRRPSRRHLLCPRHLQFASLRHDRDGRIPRPARQPEFQLGLYRARRDLERDAPRHLNDRLAAQDLPVRVSNLSSIWSVHYTKPSRYNWMLQYYLRAEGLALSWVGTGRLIFSLNYTDEDFTAVADRFVAASEKMKRDGWWWHDAPSPTRTSAADPERDVCAEVGRDRGFVMPPGLNAICVHP